MRRPQTSYMSVDAISPYLHHYYIHVCVLIVCKAKTVRWGQTPTVTAVM